MFPLSYDRWFNSRTMLPVILAYDLITRGYIAISSYLNWLNSILSHPMPKGYFNPHTVSALVEVINIITIFSNLLMTFAVIRFLVKRLKIQMQSSQRRQLRDSLTVAVALLFQNLYSCLYWVTLTGNFIQIISPNPPIWANITWVETDFLIQFMIIFNSIVTLFVVGGYRRAIDRMGRKILCMKEKIMNTSSIAKVTTVSMRHN